MGALRDVKRWFRAFGRAVDARDEDAARALFGRLRDDGPEVAAVRVFAQAQIHMITGEYTAAVDLLRAWLASASPDGLFVSVNRHLCGVGAAIALLGGELPLGTALPLLKSAGCTPKCAKRDCAVVVTLDLYEDRVDQALARALRFRRRNFHRRRARFAAYLSIAVCRAALGDQAGAAQALRRAAALDPGSPELAVARARVAMSVAPALQEGRHLSAGPC